MLHRETLPQKKKEKKQETGCFIRQRGKAKRVSKLLNILTKQESNQNSAIVHTEYSSEQEPQESWAAVKIAEASNPIRNQDVYK